MDITSHETELAHPKHRWGRIVIGLYLMLASLAPPVSGEGSRIASLLLLLGGGFLVYVGWKHPRQQVAGLSPATATEFAPTAVNPAKFKSLQIWRRAIDFHLAHWNTVLPVLPLLCFPVVGDALHSLLIRQQVHGPVTSYRETARKVWPLIFPLFTMKLYFETAAFLWALIPIYGTMRSIKHRLYWAMASNVLVFEGLSGEAGRNRCRELVDNFSEGLGVRTLITVPALLLTGFLIMWLVGGTVFAAFYSYGFWAFILLEFWVLFPASGAVNTFLYLEMLTRSDCDSPVHPLNAPARA